MSTIGDVWVRRLMRDGEFVQVEVICACSGRPVHATAWGAGVARATAHALRELSAKLLAENPRVFVEGER